MRESPGGPLPFLHTPRHPLWAGVRRGRRMSSSPTTIPLPAGRSPGCCASRAIRSRASLSGAQLIDALERTRPDLLLVDVENLGPDGEQLLERLKRDERWRDVPIVVATTLPSNGKASAALVPPSRCRRLRHEAVPRSRAPRADPHAASCANELRSARAALAAARAELERAREDVASNRQIVDILNEVTGELSATEIYRILVRRVSRALGLSRCSVVLASAGDAVGIVVAVVR